MVTTHHRVAATAHPQFFDRRPWASVALCELARDGHHTEPEPQTEAEPQAPHPRPPGRR